jgi:hypothetical protein
MSEFVASTPTPGAPRYPRRRGHTTDTDRPVARGAPMELGAEKYAVFLYLADERGERTYVNEHRFLERPDVETVKCLFEEAKRHFWLLYEGDARPEDLEVRVTYSEGENGGC